MSKAGRRLGSPKVSSIDLSFHLCSQVQTDHQPVRPPKLSLLRDPGLPSQPFKGPRTAFHGQLATLGQSLDTAVTLQGQVQAVLAAKAVPSKGSRTALATLQRAPHSFAWAAGDFRSKQLWHSRGKYRQFWQPKLSLLRDPGLPSQRFKGPRTAFHGQLAPMGQSLDTAVTLHGQVQAVLAAKAVPSKGSRTALPTLQRAQHSFSWAACAYGSKLGHSCDTPRASTGSFRRQSLSLLRDPGLPSQRFKGPSTAFHGQLAQFWPPKLSLLRDPGLPSQPFKRPSTAFHGQLAPMGQSLETAVTLQGQVQAVLAAKAVTSKGSRTALPTLQSAPHSFSWAACDFRSKLGDSCDTPGASTGSWVRQSCPF